MKRSVMRGCRSPDCGVARLHPGYDLHQLQFRNPRAKKRGPACAGPKHRGLNLTRNRRGRPVQVPGGWGAEESETRTEPNPETLCQCRLTRPRLKSGRNMNYLTKA